LEHIICRDLLRWKFCVFWTLNKKEFGVVLKGLRDLKSDVVHCSGDNWALVIGVVGLCSE